jgi:AhpD family alkylhydroperoxidase
MYDIKNLAKLTLDEKNPKTMKAFWAFDKAAFVSGAIDVLNKQLMAVAVALTTQCPYCIDLHVKSARDAGATDQMLAERRLRGGSRPTLDTLKNVRRR